MRTLLFAMLFMAHLFTFTQELTQTIRGRVIDNESEMSLPGAAVIVTSVLPVKGVSTDFDGYFVIKNVPIGRHNLKVKFLGYEEIKLPNILVGSAKEVVLNISMTESYENIEEVIVIAKRKKAETNNEMATVSSRSFSTEETSRYAASVDDPARMAQSYAGVSSTDDLSNEIIVRGNSPLGLLWRINGIEVPSPNHFSEEGASGGGISALSINMLDNSDFFTGAFPAEYGNATSGVFDVKLRNGNSNKQEYVFQLGVLGTDIALEGPLKKGSNASYLINYRYSTLGLLTGLGIIDLGGDNNIFQDLAFQFNVPTQKAGVFKLFALGGLSNGESSVNEAEIKADPKGEYYDDNYNSNVGVIGLSNQLFFGEKAYLKTTLSYSAQNIGFTERLINNFTLQRDQLYNDRFVNESYRANSFLNYKFNVKHTLRIGGTYSKLGYNLFAEGDDDFGQNVTYIDQSGSTDQLQQYAQWKYRFHEKWTLNTGYHYLYFNLNGNQSFEPRLGLKYKIDDVQSLSAGFGLHSRIAPLSFYNSEIEDDDGSFSKANKNLEFTKALHYVIGYDRQLAEELRVKIEVYYQDLYDVPVSPDSNSTGSGVNFSYGINNTRVIAEGTSQNVGLEFTLEKFFSNNYYYLFTASIFNSKYQMPDGREFNTRFNSNYRLTLLGGKEFPMGKNDNNLLALNGRFIWAGGNRVTPIDENASRLEQETVFIEARAYEDQVPAYWRGDVTVSYRINKEKVAHIISLQIQNVTNRENVAGYYFDTNEQEVLPSTQFGLIPILKYRLEF